MGADQEGDDQADAALAEVSKLLLEVKQLVSSSTNSGAISDEEIQANQLQIDSLLESINRVANSTTFNTKKLLNGQLGYTVSAQNQTDLPRLQIFGARGYSRDYPLERMARDVRMFTIAGGTAQVLRTLVASKLLGQKLPQHRGGYGER